MDDHPNWSFNTIKSKYPCFAHRCYYTKWKQQIKGGGSRSEISYEIDKYVTQKFTEARDEFKPVHDMDLRRWALQRAAEFPGVRHTFVASPKWVLDFKRRHRVTSRKVTKLVSKRNLKGIDEILARVEEFRKEMRQEQSNFKEENIWNTDQIGFNYEYVDARTLSWKGEEITFGAGFSPKNKVTHSYTVQYIINVAGEIVGPAYVCLQEPSGKLGELVKTLLFKAPNLVVSCTKSGKMNGSQVKFFFENVAKPNIRGSVLYSLDSWTGHVNCDAYNNVDTGKLVVKVIPKNGTEFCQPLDVYFNRQLKYFVKRIKSFANIEDIDTGSRNDTLKIQCLTHFTLSAPVFKNMIRYSWIKSGLVDIDKHYFENVRDVCFNFKETECMHMECAEKAFVKCSWCRLVICFDCFFNKVHAFECLDRPLIFRN